MSKHMLNKDKWKIFLETALNISTVEVLSVEDGKLTFKATNEDLWSIRSALSDPEFLKNTVAHAVPTLPINFEDKIYAQEDAESPLVTIFNESGQTTFCRLFTPKLLQSLLNLDLINHWNTANDYPGKKIMQFKCEAINGIRAKNLIQDLELLNFMLSNKEEVAEIILGKRDAYQAEPEDAECEATEFGSKIFSWEQSGKNLQVTFNYGIIPQAAQEYIHMFEPVIVFNEGDVSGSGVYTINSDYLLEYLGGIYTSGIVLHEEQEGYRPILFSPQGTDTENISGQNLFNLILDISGSMSHHGNFPKESSKNNTYNLV